MPNYAIGDRCSHQDISLSEGEVLADELTLECWKHGSAFSLETGEPNYNEMDPRLAASVRESLPGVLSFIRQAGALKTVTFKSVNEIGMDTYQVDFEHARVLWFIAPLSPDGKVIARGFRPLT